MTTLAPRYNSGPIDFDTPKATALTGSDSCPPCLRYFDVMWHRMSFLRDEKLSDWIALWR
jgi:hypothetical protein